MKTYALAGTSERSYGMYAKSIRDDFSEYAKIIGAYDINYKRASLFAQDIGGFKAFEDFDDMLRTTKPDVVIVTTVDAYHHEYIIKSLEAGCEVISEKPMTIGVDECNAILDAEKRTKGKLTVTFNYRFVPYVTKIKEIIQSGEIGRILSVDFEWILDRNMDVSAHGTSYFRRWNRYMDKSGGLLVHKSTHHFDLINWWIDDEPLEVFAFGDLKMYGKNGAFRGEKCRCCDKKDTCEYYFDITNKETINKFFIPAEYVDNYNKDNCVFADDIDIYDTMSLNVKYKQGALMTYSLIAHAPYEGYRVSINGTKGRLEAEEIHTGIKKRLETNQTFQVFLMDDTIKTYEVPIDLSGHGGGDRRLQRMLFARDLPDPFGHMAGSRAGANSLMIGACANISIKEKRLVNIQELLKL